MELIRGSKDTLFGCEEEVRRWWRVEEEREDRDLTLHGEEMDAMAALVATEFLGESVHQDTSVF